MIQIVVRFKSQTPWVLEAKAEGLTCTTIWNDHVWVDGNFEACARAWLRGKGFDESVHLSRGCFKENSPFGDVYVFIPEKLLKRLTE